MLEKLWPSLWEMYGRAYTYDGIVLICLSGTTFPEAFESRGKDSSDMPDSAKAHDGDNPIVMAMRRRGSGESLLSEAVMHDAMRFFTNLKNQISSSWQSAAGAVLIPTLSSPFRG